MTILGLQHRRGACLWAYGAHSESVAADAVAQFPAVGIEVDGASTAFAIDTERRCPIATELFDAHEVDIPTVAGVWKEDRVTVRTCEQGAFHSLVGRRCHCAEIHQFDELCMRRHPPRAAPAVAGSVMLGTCNVFTKLRITVIF